MSVPNHTTKYKVLTDAYLECRLLIEQLAEVNPVHLNDDARLAFWINLYNALLMHVR